MDCPGEYLKRERLLRDVSLEDISKEIKVPVKLLRALEADDYPSMPHTAFVKGFIRAYCKHLGLDENDALLRYELYLKEVAEFEVPVETSRQMDVQERSFPVRRLLTVSLVVLGVIIIAGIYFFSSSPEVVDLISSPKEVDGSVKEVARAIAVDKGEEEAEVLREHDKEVSPAPKESVTAANNQVALSPAAPVKRLKRAEPATIELASGEHLLRLHASELTWMKITIDSDEPFEVLMQPGETLQRKGKVFFYS